MYDDWLESSLKSNEEERISSLRQLVRHLPACNLLLLRHLICVLHRINRHSVETKMTSCNLGVCLGPSLLWSNTTTLDNQRKDVGRIVTIVTDLIDHAPDIFGPDCLHLFRDLESCSITVFSSDQQVDVGIESTDCDSLQRHRGQRSKDDESTTSRSHANALSPTSSLDPPPSPSAPVAPPRRKRSSVVVPPVFVSIAEESTATDHSATPSSIATMQVLEDRPHFPRSHSSDSASSRDWLGKSYLTETTDGETMEDSDETWATEEDLDGRSEDLVEDDEDSLMASPTVERRKEYGRKDGGGGAPTTVERRNQSNPVTVETKTTKDVIAMDEGNWSNHSARPRDRISAVDPPPLNRSNALMSFSSTEDSTAGGDRGGGGASGREKSLFFGGSFSSTAGSDADLSNFAESIDSGTVLSESFELQGVIRRRRQMEVNDGESNSSSVVVTMPLQSEDDPRNREVNAINRKHPSSKHHRWSEIDVKWDGGESLPVEATTKSSDEHGVSAQAISDSGVNVCEADISSMTNDSRPLKTDTSGHVHSRKSNQTPDVSGQTTLRSRRHSFGCRDQENGGGGADLYGSQTRQRRGMTHKGSDVFPGLLSKTLRSRASRMLNPNGLDGKSSTGVKSDNEARGKLFNDPSDRLNLDERIIVSDIEFSESDGKTRSLPRVDRRTGNSCKNPDSTRASRLPLENQDAMQSDKDVVKLENTSRTKLMHDVNKEDEERRPSAIRLRLEPPAYDEAVKQLKSQQHSAARVTSSTNEHESVLQADHQKEVEQTTVEEKERKQKKQQPVEDCSIRQGKHESVGIIVELDAHALAKLVARSCGDLSKTAEQDGMTNRANRFPRTEQESKLKHVNSLGSLSSGDSLRKRFCIPRSKRWSIRDSSSSSSSNSSNSDDEAALQRRLEDNVLKKRILRKKRRRSRKARNSDTRLQTDRENRVNLVRSKSDSNTLLRELIFKNEDAKHVRETFRTEISRRKETDDQRTFSRDILQNRKTGKENLNQGTIRVRNLEADNDDDDDKLASTTREVNRKKSVGLKDRDWHKDLVREIEFTQKSESSRHPNSVTSAVVPAESESKWQRKTNYSSGSSSFSNKLRTPNNPGNAANSTLPAAFKCISRIPHGRLLDYSSSDSTRHCIDDAAHIPQRSPGRSSDDSAHGDRRLGGKRNDEASVNYSGTGSGGTGSGGDGSEGSTANLIELRVNQLRKSDRDFQRGDFQRGDANRSKEVITATKCPSKEGNTFHIPGNIGVQQKPLQRANTLSLDTEHGNKRNSFKEKTDTQPAREIVAQPVIKTSSENENDTISEKTSSDPNKSSTPLFERISVKDIVAIKNSSSGSADGRLDPTKPPAPPSFRKGEERTEAWRPETGRTVARRSSHVTPQVKPEVDISLTPELGRRTLPRIEQKPRISLGAQLPMNNYPPEIANRLLPPVCGRSPSVKSSNTRETTEVEQRKNAEATSPKLSCQTTASDPNTSDSNSQRQKHTGVTKSPWQGTPTSSPLSTRSSNASLSRSDGVLSTNPGKVTLLTPDVEACAFEKGEKRIDCGGESEAGGLDGVPQSHGSGSMTAGKSPRTEMPWSVANLRNRYGNQNPQ